MSSYPMAIPLYVAQILVYAFLPQFPKPEHDMYSRVIQFDIIHAKHIEESSEIRISNLWLQIRDCLESLD